MGKREIDGIYHKVSPKHVGRYAVEFAGRHNDRPLDTKEQMTLLAKGAVGVRLTYKDLIADNGRSNFARPLGDSEEEAKMLEKKAKREEENLWPGTPPEWVKGYEGTTGIATGNWN